MVKGSSLKKNLKKNQDLSVGEIVKKIRTGSEHEVLRISNEKDATYIRVAQSNESYSTYGSEAFFTLYERIQQE